MLVEILAGQYGSLGSGAAARREGGAKGVGVRQPHDFGADVYEEHLGEGNARAGGDAAHFLDEMRRESVDRGQEAHRALQHLIACRQSVRAAKRPPTGFELQCFAEHVRIATDEVSGGAAVLEAALIRRPARFY